eukprot:212809_1
MSLEKKQCEGVDTDGTRKDKSECVTRSINDCGDVTRTYTSDRVVENDDSNEDSKHEADYSDDESSFTDDDDDTDEDCSYNSDDYDDEGANVFNCDCVHCEFDRTSPRSVENDDTEEDEDEDEQSCDGPSCAICFSTPEFGNPFVYLPCCGTMGREERSSTRFCHECLEKTLKAQNPWVYFEWDPRLLGECPRCRQLITMREEIGSIQSANFEQACRHARHKENVMRDILVTAAFSNPNFLPLELLNNEPDKLLQMCNWGIFYKVRKGLYAMYPHRQEELRDYIERDVIESDGTPGLCSAAGDLLAAGIYAALKFKIYTAVRLVNQSWVNVLVHFFNFPVLDHLWQELMLVGLNIFLGIMIIQVILFIALYGIICYCVIKFLGWSIRQTTRFWRLLGRKSSSVEISAFVELYLLLYLVIGAFGIGIGFLVRFTYLKLRSE